MTILNASDVTPAKPEALEFFEALAAALAAEAKLTDARKNASGYTGQYSTADYVAEEQEEFNRAADALYDTAKRLFTPQNP